ncbi:UNVERIFIED_CONTAM: hypothetical protein K2H54_028916 [Gekko kuhli]
MQKSMAAVKRKEKSQVRQRNRTQSKRGKPTKKKTTGKRVNRSPRKKRSSKKGLPRKVSLAAERLRKKKHHVSITVSDVKNALKKIMARKSDGKSVPSIAYKCH